MAEAGYVDSDGVLELESIPKSVVVLGGGYTACELGQFLARMGAQTTMLIRSSHLLTRERRRRRRRADRRTSATKASNVVTERRCWTCGAKARKRSFATCATAASTKRPARRSSTRWGASPNTAGLSLESAGVAYDPAGGIAVDSTLRTSNPNIFAVGDVTGEYMLVHVAIYQGEVASRNACQDASEVAEYGLMGAHTMFTDPQVAVAGMSEKELRERGIGYVVGRYDFAEHGKAQCLGKTKGFVKMMADATSGRILGARSSVRKVRS